jgi:hypothetical protein
MRRSDPAVRMTSRASRLRMISASGFLVLLLVAVPTSASAETASYTDITLRFTEGCTGTGSLRLTKGGYTETEPLTWSRDKPIHHEFFSGGFELPYHLRLKDADGTLLFETALTLRGIRYQYSATLDCTTVPYRLALPDTATAVPAEERESLTSVAVIATASVLVMLAFARTARRRRTT